MGGVAAVSYSDRHSDGLAGLILWDAYPAASNDLADSALAVASIFRSTLEGDAPQKFKDTRHLLPESTRWIPVRGGVHMYFGSFSGGGYQEEWTPAIAAERQHQIVVESTLAMLGEMTG